MSLKVVQAELLKTLNAQTANFASTSYKIGLYQNNYTPGDSDSIGSITPCTFSGYSGLIPLTSWNTAVWNAPRATANHSPVSWTHDGGATGNSVYGYYVVDGSGALAWAERYSGAPVVMNSAGQVYQVTPQFTRRSEY